MAFSRALFLTLVFSFVLLTLIQSHHAMAQNKTAPTPPITGKASINCVGACKYRCSKSWKPKMCNKLCTGCCNQCGCVPNGPTAPRTSACACYANRRNPKTGAFKCP